MARSTSVDAHPGGRPDALGTVDWGTPSRATDSAYMSPSCPFAVRIRPATGRVVLPHLALPHPHDAPAVCSASSVDRRSRSALRRIFSSHRTALGPVHAVLRPWSGQPCQKHPSTNTATCRAGSTKSGVHPFAIRRWSRNRPPAAWTALRSSTSGVVLTLVGPRGGHRALCSPTAATPPQRTWTATKWLAEWRPQFPASAFRARWGPGMARAAGSARPDRPARLPSDSGRRIDSPIFPAEAEFGSRASP